MVWCGVVWCGVVSYGVLCCGVVWWGVVWCGVVWCGVEWCGVMTVAINEFGEKLVKIKVNKELGNTQLQGGLHVAECQLLCAQRCRW